MESGCTFCRKKSPHINDCFREIIDESDVFIDVHRAIRRMAPAPRYRVPKGEVVAAPESPVVVGEDLIDLNDEQKGPTPAPRRNASMDGQKLNVNGSHFEPASSAKAAFHKRRTSSTGASTNRENPPKRTNTTDRLEHLKHLGPSNLASRPRQTRYNTVKIKPGGITMSENNSKGREPSESSRMLSPTPAPQGELGAGLLQSAGKDAKDGVLALQVGYGSTGSSPKAANGTSPIQEHNENSSSPPHKPNNQFNNSTTALANQSTASLGSLQKRNSGSSKPRKTDSVVLSGSITENIVDAGGIKKTVLEMTSSSSDDVEDSGAATASGAADDSRGSSHSSGGPVGEGKENDGGGKKKRRRRKRKGAKADGEGSEETPLLGRQD